MPELPDLVIVSEIMNRRVIGQSIDKVNLVRPLVVRLLDQSQTVESYLEGRVLEQVVCRGKMLIFSLGDARHMVVSPMLMGHLRICEPSARILKRDYISARLSGGHDLRYNDTRGMGKIYLTDDLADVPGLAELGPDALDVDLTEELFLERLRRHRGEIKGILTRGACIAGIGNAYADEILFRAGIYPFRKRPKLSLDEQRGLYRAMRDVLSEAVVTLRERMGDDSSAKIRDFLAVHNRKGQPCPVCGSTISEIKVQQRATSFCRACQPGTMFD